MGMPGSAASARRVAIAKLDDEDVGDGLRASGDGKGSRDGEGLLAHIDGGHLVSAQGIDESAGTVAIGIYGGQASVVFDLCEDAPGTVFV